MIRLIFTVLIGIGSLAGAGAQTGPAPAAESIRAPGAPLHRIANGDEFEGELREGKPHGAGVYRFGTGDRYEGEFVDGVKVGKGRYFYASGDRYEGDFFAGSAHGSGTYFYANGSVYIGTFEHGRASGTGVIVGGDRSRYEGAVRDGRKHGVGAYQFAAGVRYVGQFSNDQMTGVGVYTFPNGDRYEGEVINGRLEGMGRLATAGGRVHLGSFAEDLFIGENASAAEVAKRALAVAGGVTAPTTVAVAASAPKGEPRNAEKSPVTSAAESAGRPDRAPAPSPPPPARPAAVANAVPAGAGAPEPDTKGSSGRPAAPAVPPATASSPAAIAPPATVPPTAGVAPPATVPAPAPATRPTEARPANLAAAAPAPPPASVANRPAPPPEPLVRTAESRTALVIGNGTYRASPLRNARKDARDMTRVLRELGFNTRLIEDARQSDMYEAVRWFGNELKAGGVGLFFYAGHGVQVKGENYLIPVDADIQGEDEVPYRAFQLRQVLDKMETARNKTNIVMLDACRDNPFESQVRLIQKGLAKVEAPGFLVSFAASPGAVAFDGDGDNGIYTKHVLANIRAPELPVEQMFKRVRNGVEAETRRQQIPLETSGLRDDFFFRPGQPAAGRETVARPGDVGGARSPEGTVLEVEFWRSIQGSSVAADFEAYLQQFPNGTFAPLARNRLRSLGTR